MEAVLTGTWGSGWKTIHNREYQPIEGDAHFVTPTLVKDKYAVSSAASESPRSNYQVIVFDMSVIDKRGSPY